jgi:hypothetical protein
MADSSRAKSFVTPIFVVAVLIATYFGWRYMEERKDVPATAPDGAATTQSSDTVATPAGSAAPANESAAANATTGEVPSGYDTVVAPARPPLSARERKRLRQKIAQANHLPAETSLLDGRDIDRGKAQALVDGNEFDKKFKQLQQDAQAGILAHELSLALSDEFAVRIAASRLKMRMPEVSCGMRLCLARIQGHLSPSEWNDFLSTWRNDPAANASNAVSRLVELADGGKELRLIF